MKTKHTSDFILKPFDSTGIKILFSLYYTISRSKLTFLYVLFFFFINDGRGQTFHISGNVSTSTTPVNYASVTFIDQSDASKKYSTITDADGNYQLDLITAVKEAELTMPQSIELAQNYPNPFSTETEIPYKINKQTDVSIKIYNILGQEIRTFNVGLQTNGTHGVRWDGKNNFGNRVTPGIYFYQLHAGNETLVKKMIYSDGNSDAGISIPKTVFSSVEMKKIDGNNLQGGTFTVKIQNSDITSPKIWTAAFDNIVVQENTTFNFTVEEFKGKLVFVMNDSTIGPWGIYTMNIDGSNLKPIAVPGDSVYFPGPWGNYYVIDDYYSINNPRWSPDGTKIVCQLMWAAEGYVIMIMNADGSNKHVLWKVRSAAQLPQWSPDGDKILFRRHAVLGIVIGTGIVDSSGENDRDFKSIFDDKEGPDVFEGDSIWITGDFQWGNNSNLILGLGSVNKNPDTINVIGSNPANEIFSFDSQTDLIAERITHNSIDEGGFQLSSDGQLIAFRRGHWGINDNEIHILSLTDGKVSTIHFGATIDSFWNWSNDGSKIVYAKDEDPDRYRSSFYLYVVDIKYPEEQIRLTDFIAIEPDLFIPDN